MKKKYRVFITFLVIVALITTLYIFTDWFSKVTGYIFGEEEQIRVARCLEKHGAEFYTSLYCAECEKQKQLFGTAIKLIKSVDCGEDKEFCPNVRELPAWYINKEIHYGLKNISELNTLAACNTQS